MSHGGVALVYLGAFVVVVVLSFAIRRPLQRRIFTGMGGEEWRAAARRLSWRDRWTLYVATTWGRAVPPRLAPLAVQRGAVLVAIHERSTARPSLRRASQVIGVLGLVNLVLQILGLFLDHRGVSGSWRLISPLILIGLGFGGRPLQRAGAMLAQRSVTLNQEQNHA